MTLEPKCPLDGTTHADQCPLKPILGKMDAVVTCPFRPDCSEMLEDEKRTILLRLYEAARMVNYYNSAEGEWARETAERKAANEELRLALHEAAIRNLDYDLSGFQL